MGRKKKFIDKKKAATFQLMARDSSDPYYDESVSGSERVFVRVDNNVSYNVDTFDENYDSGYEDDPDSIFADAPEDGDGGAEGETSSRPRRAALPENVRKEILELGFPDDGYNYLMHLREIKNTGGGSAFFSNPKAKLEQLPNDVKAYDASRIQIPEVKADPDEKAIYDVAARSVGVRVQKAVDPEVAALLDDSDLSRFGSDVEDLEEDFIVQANAPEEGEDSDFDEKVNLVAEAEVSKKAVNELDTFGHQDDAVDHRGVIEDINYEPVKAGVDSVIEKARPRRLLDEQFDLLELQEYGSDSDDGYMPEEDESRAERLKQALNDRGVDDLELDDKYRAPADILRDSEGSRSKEPLDAAADVIRRCVEYGEKYEETQDEDVVVVEESSDESEVWDCETVISTYSNLDNHPGKIGAPEIARKKKLAQTVAGALNSTNNMITLRGKEKLPVDFLPQRKGAPEKTKDVSSLKTQQPKKKPIGQETKEEKKERKAAVKEERREGRRMKKEIKELYRCEAQRAQKVVAISGPSSIHLM